MLKEDYIKKINLNIKLAKKEKIIINKKIKMLEKEKNSIITNWEKNKNWYIIQDFVKKAKKNNESKKNFLKYLNNLESLIINLKNLKEN